MISPKIKRICTENIVEDVIDFECEGPTSQITEDVQTQHRGIQTLSLEKSILASQIETKIHQYQMLENRTDPTKKKSKTSKYNPMAFEAIYRGLLVYILNSLRFFLIFWAQQKNPFIIGIQKAINQKSENFL